MTSNDVKGHKTKVKVHDENLVSIMHTQQHSRSSPRIGKCNCNKGRMIYMVVKICPALSGPL